MLDACGVRVGVVDPGCCGRPLLSQGLVGPARARARRALDRLAPHAIAGRRIVVLEPSCWSMLVDDLPRLVPGDPRARWVADAAMTFERAVARARPAAACARNRATPSPTSTATPGRSAAAARAPRRWPLIPGLAIRDSGAGCCGMAGAFGYRHGDMSRAIAEDRLAPAVRSATVAVAAGTSCRAQITRTTGRPALHPAEHLARRLA